jgi:hypothetical protein
MGVKENQIQKLISLRPSFGVIKKDGWQQKGICDIKPPKQTRSERCSSLGIITEYKIKRP